MSNIKRICDKCSCDIAKGNDALDLAIEVHTMRKYGIDYKEEEVDPWILTAYLGYASRHLLPVVEGGRVLCEGSPSRAEFLEGQPRDTRGFSYTIEDEVLYRAAFKRMQSRVASRQAQ